MSQMWRGQEHDEQPAEHHAEMCRKEREAVKTREDFTTGMGKLATRILFEMENKRTPTPAELRVTAEARADAYFAEFERSKFARKVGKRLEEDYDEMERCQEDQYDL